MKMISFRFLILLIVFLGNNCLTFSQNLPNIDSLLNEDMKIKNYKFIESQSESWEKAEGVVLQCIDTLIKTNNTNPDRNREKIIGFVLEYSQKGIFKYPVEDSLALKLMKIDSEIWTYYVLGMVYYKLKNNLNELKIEDIQLQGLQFMLEYISDEKNITNESSLNYKSVKENLYLKELQRLKQNEQLIQIIKK